MIDSPSIVPELDDMADAERIARLILTMARNPPQQAPQAASVRELLRLTCIGAKCSDSASLGGAGKRNSTMGEDMAICADFVRRLKNPTRGRNFTPTQILRDMAREYRKPQSDEFPDRKITMSKSGIDAAIKRQCRRGGRAGLQNTGDCKLRVCHCAIIEETKR